MAPTGVSHGTKGPVVWLRCHGIPRRKNTGDSLLWRVRNFKEITGVLVKIYSTFLNFFKCSPTASGTQNPAIQWKPALLQGPSSLSTPYNHLPKVGLLTFQCLNTLRQNLQEYLENFKYDYRNIRWTTTPFTLCTESPGHSYQQFGCQGATIRHTAM